MIFPKRVQDPELAHAKHVDGLRGGGMKLGGWWENTGRKKKGGEEMMGKHREKDSGSRKQKELREKACRFSDKKSVIGT